MSLHLQPGAAVDHPGDGGDLPVGEVPRPRPRPHHRHRLYGHRAEALHHGAGGLGPGRQAAQLGRGGLL